MNKEEALNILKTSNWKKQPGLDYITTNDPRITHDVIEATAGQIGYGRDENGVVSIANKKFLKFLAENGVNFPGSSNYLDKTVG